MRIQKGGAARQPTGVLSLALRDPLAGYPEMNLGRRMEALDALTRRPPKTFDPRSA
jgi:hypothetical protein